MIALLLIPLLHFVALDAGCTSGASTALTFEVSADCSMGNAPTNPGPASPSPYSDYYFKPLCIPEGNDVTVPPVCVLLHGCQPEEIPGYLYGRRDEQWVRLDLQCRSTTSPTLTPDIVAHAFRRIPLPRLRLVAQPSGRTLVNFDTIFHVRAERIRREVTLLGQRVALDIEPSSFSWRWGDGRTSTTTSPGAPYPSKSVVHRYLDADVTVRPQVSVTWTARWRVDGGRWAPVAGSVTTTGPAATLRVVEAVPNLSGPG